MKKLLLILLILSLSYNIYSVLRRVADRQRTAELFMLYDVKNTTYPEGLKYLKKRLKGTGSPGSRYYFIHVWDTTTTTDSFKLYMTRLDSLIGAVHPKNTTTIYATEMRQSLIEDYLALHHFSYKNGLILCDMDDFISGIYVHHKKKQKSRPMQAIIDSSGTFIYYTTQLNEYPQRDTALIRHLQSL